MRSIVILSLLVAQAAALQFHVNIHPFISARMDPIIQPGKVSSHVHQIYGAVNFRSVLNTPEEQQRAECSTANVQVDNSNYWAPLLYFINAQGKYEALQSRGGRAYYQINGPNVQPFPDGLRMVAGTAMSRNPYNQKVAAIELGYGCDSTPRADGGAGYFLPNGTSYPNGCKNIGMTVMFPSCGWANQSLDSDDHFSHMAFPISHGGGNMRYDPFKGEFCPESHPIHYPNIHFETYYQLSPSQQKQWRSGDHANLILANGDTVGLSGHADFVMGWDQKAFTQAINECGKTVNDADAEECPSFKASANHTSSRNCRYMGMIPDEEIGYGKALDALPGCNPRWDLKDGDDKPKCTVNHTPGWTAPNALFKTDYPVPVALDTGGKDIRDVSPVMDNAVFEPYDNQTYCCGSVAPNLGHWLTGTAEDIANNKDAATAKNKIDKVYGMVDDRAYSAMTPTTAPPKLYNTLTGFPSVTFTANGIATAPPSAPTTAPAEAPAAEAPDAPAEVPDAPAAEEPPVATSSATSPTGAQAAMTANASVTSSRCKRRRQF